MKRYLLLGCFLGAALASLACNNAYLQLRNYSDESDGWAFELELCIDAGRSIAGEAGGAGDTYSFTLAFYAQQPNLQLSDYTTTLTGQTTGHNASAIVVDNGFKSSKKSLVYFIASGPLTCVNSSATCGTIHTECYEINVKTTVFPDSIKAYGIEGNNDTDAGCYPDIYRDMMINLAPLPVEWSKVSLKQEGIGVRVFWETLSETQNQFFEVERRGREGDIEVVARVDGAGNSIVPLSYSIFDVPSASGLQYYRIRQVDFDGQSSYSDWQSINLASAFEPLKLFPNPTAADVYYQLPIEAGVKRVLLRDGSGRVLQEWEGDLPRSIPMGEWPSGVYYVELWGERRRYLGRISKVNM